MHKEEKIFLELKTTERSWASICSFRNLTLFHIGRTPFTRLQIVFFKRSVISAGELQMLVIFYKHSMENKVFNTKIANFYPELGNMTSFDNGPFKNLQNSI